MTLVHWDVAPVCGNMYLAAEMNLTSPAVGCPVPTPSLCSLGTARDGWLRCASSDVGLREEEEELRVGEREELGRGGREMGREYRGWC